MYTSASEVERKNTPVIANVGEKLEKALATTAELGIQLGRKQFIVAGGETSGAVTRALGADTYLISESVAPGVPVMIPVNRPAFRLVLKSGNFGSETFFAEAVQITRKEANR